MKTVFIILFAILSSIVTASETAFPKTDLAKLEKNLLEKGKIEEYVLLNIIPLLEEGIDIYEQSLYRAPKLFYLGNNNWAQIITRQNRRGKINICMWVSTTKGTRKTTLKVSRRELKELYNNIQTNN